jgi:hypothetical protein
MRHREPPWLEGAGLAHSADSYADETQRIAGRFSRLPRNARMTSEIFTDARLRDKNIDALKRYLRSKLSGYRVAFSYITPDNLLYRGVPWQQRPSKINQLSYPPVDRVTRLGRVNRIGKPVFYCSRAPEAVFYELRAKEGDLIALSEWEVTEPLWMHNLGFQEDALRRLGASDVAIRPRWNNPIPNEIKHNARLRQQISLAFTEDVRDGQEYRYKQSIAINELLFDDADPCPNTRTGHVLVEPQERFIRR